MNKALFKITCTRCKAEWVCLDVLVTERAGSTPMSVKPRITCLNCGAEEVFGRLLRQESAVV